MKYQDIQHRCILSPDIAAVLAAAPEVVVAKSRQDLLDLALGGSGNTRCEVSFEVPGKGRVVEADVVRSRNGVVVNYRDAAMRRRDPESMVVADDLPTEQTRFIDRFGAPFTPLRQQVLDWLSKQALIVLPFWAGDRSFGYASLLIAPKAAGFFAAALADLQDMIPGDQVPANFTPDAVIFLAPTFRHTHCAGRQVVVHNRQATQHEIFSLNLYPGPSAKKGVYGALLSIGEREGWLTAHGSTVQVVTPYDNTLTIMHEGASGGGKSEMLEYAHREPDGRMLLGENVITGEKRFISLPQGCRLRPVTDDMALCHPSLQNGSRKLVIKDAESAWFVRVNHIEHYGTDHELERLTIAPAEPLVFLNIEGQPGATTLIWEHTQDAPGKPCPNPRVILPRRIIPNVINEPVEVDVRSFGVRCPPCTAAQATYGIIGLIQVLPPALAWLWRLVAPRGHANPSIIQTEGMASEGVGSYWPFATGRRVDQANLLLRQIRAAPLTRFVLLPNQHVGAWRMDFMPQWLAREYLARRGGVKFRPDQTTPSRCSLLGWSLTSMQIEGVPIPTWFLQVETQPEVKEAAFDAGAKVLAAFFEQNIRPYLDSPDLDPLGRQIITHCLEGGSVEGYERLLHHP